MKLIQSGAARFQHFNKYFCLLRLPFFLVFDGNSLFSIWYAVCGVVHAIIVSFVFNQSSRGKEENRDGRGGEQQWLHLPELLKENLQKSNWLNSFYMGNTNISVVRHLRYLRFNEQTKSIFYSQAILTRSLFFSV